MASNLGSIVSRTDSTISIPAALRDGIRDPGDARLLMEAFDTFAQASSSLEAAFLQLQKRVRVLSGELERKNAALRRSLTAKREAENYLKRILESLPCGVLVLDAAKAVRLCNPMAARILGEQTERPCTARGRRKRLANRVLCEYFAASVSAAGERREVEIPYLAGGQLRVLATSGTPLTGPSGDLIGTLHIIRDITELKLLEEQSKRGERLSAMGEMAVELAHEIRNPLGSIELFASLLEKELGKDGDLGRWAQNIRVGSRSLNHIITNMLHFANPLSPAFHEVDVHALVGEVLEFTRPIMRQRDITAEQQLGARDCRILGDHDLLKQVLLNLVLNAMQAMPSCGSLTISTRDVSELPGGAACSGLEIRVRDTGVGIAPENLARIFDPFFTTNRNGTGLGLSVVHRIIDRHSGFITVESRPDEGTTFTIVLPNARLVSGAA